MFTNRLFHLFIIVAILALTACGVSNPTMAPATATKEPIVLTLVKSYLPNFNKVS